jgi:hypothetical protein
MMWIDSHGSHRFGERANAETGFDGSGNTHTHTHTHTQSEQNNAIIGSIKIQQGSNLYSEYAKQSELVAIMASIKIQKHSTRFN